MKNNVVFLSNAVFKMPYVGRKNDSLRGLSANFVIKNNVQYIDLATASEDKGIVKISGFGNLKKDLPSKVWESAGLKNPFYVKVMLNVTEGDNS